MKPTIADSDITVTTATRTEAEVRDGLDPGAREQTPPAAADAAGAVKDKAKPAVAGATLTPEQEAESDKPDPEISEAARKLRGGRADVRKEKIQREIAEGIKERNQVRDEIARLKAEHAKLATSPADRQPATETKPAPAAAIDAATKKFTFPTYEQYQVDHPDASWEDYSDIRQDARTAFIRQQDEEKTAAERTAKAREASERAELEAVSHVETHVATFKASHPDYVETLAKVELDLATPQAQGLRQLLLRAGQEAPAILYYLGSHPEDAQALMAAPAPMVLVEKFTEVRLAAKAAAPASATPAGGTESAAPRSPRKEAPAPLSVVPGGATHSPTLQQLAEDTEDADSYIERRRQQLRRTG